jgi:hypothetical protein
VLEYSQASPIVVTADRLDGDSLTYTGNVELRVGDVVMKADKLSVEQSAAAITPAPASSPLRQPPGPLVPPVVPPVAPTLPVSPEAAPPHLPQN